MKTFLKIDYYIQTLVFVVTLLTLVILSTYEEYNGVLFCYYYIVGGFQLVSFLLRIYFPYKKNIFFHLYGLSIIPIWLGLLGAYLDIEFLTYLMVFAMIGLFYAPIMFIFYILYCYDTTKFHKESSN